MAWNELMVSSVERAIRLAISYTCDNWPVQDKLCLAAAIPCHRVLQQEYLISGITLQQIPNERV